MRRIGEDVANRLNYTPGSVTADSQRQGNGPVPILRNACSCDRFSYLINNGIPMAEGLLISSLRIS